METNTRRIRQKLGRDGWYLARHGRKHDIYWHAEIRAAIKVPRHTKVSPGVARDIAKVAGWEV